MREKSSKNTLINVSIEARMTSSRLPGKVLKLAQGMPLLELLIRRVRQAKLVNQVIVATTLNRQDDPIIELCERMNAPYYRGSELDVLARVVDCHRHFKTDVIVELTGDNPLVDPALIDQCIRFYLDNDVDYVSNFGPNRNYPIGQNVQVFPFERLEEISKSESDIYIREHVSPMFYRSGLYRTGYVSDANPEPGQRDVSLTVDTQNEFEFIKAIAESFSNPDFSLREIMQLLGREPDLAALGKKPVVSDKKTLKIFAHDAAAANATLAYALEQQTLGYQVEAFAKGPAKKIFASQIPQFVQSQPPRFLPSDLVVTGLSGIHSKYELEMIRLAKIYGVAKTIAIMDVPYNLDLRFQRDGQFLDESYLPSEIWIPKIVEKSSHPALTSRLVERANPYWEYVFKNHYAQSPALQNDFIRKNKNQYVLFLTDYTSEIYGSSLGYTEFTILETYLRTHAKTAAHIPIIVRLHPAEAKDKYDFILKSFPQLGIEVSTSELAEDVYYSGLVCGIMSSVFYESARLGRPTWSLQLGATKARPWNPEGVLDLYSQDELHQRLSQWANSKRS